MESHAALSPSSPAGGLQSSSRPSVLFNQTAANETVTWELDNGQPRGQDKESRDTMKDSLPQEANTSDSQGAKTQSEPQSASKSNTTRSGNLDEDNAEDENVQQAVFVDPNERSDNVREPLIGSVAGVDGQPTDTKNESEAGKETNEEEEEDDEQISRRIFLGAQKLIDPADWLNLRGQRSKLFGGGSHMSVRKNPRRKRRKNSNKSRQPNGKSQTRRGLGAVAHEGFVGLADRNSTSSVAGNLNPISSSLRQHFPSLSGSIPQAVQRLLQTKLSTSSMVAVPARQPSQQAMSPHQYFKHVNGFMDHQHPSDLVNQWSSSDELPTYTPGEPLRLPMSSANQPSQPVNSAQMIPIKIIGLDPTVAESILNAPEEAHTNNLRPVNYPVRAATTTGVDADGGSRGLRAPLSDRQRASSIVHIHHFHHTQAKSANQQQQQQQQPPRLQRLPPTSNSASRANDQSDETNHSVDSHSSAVQQPDKVYVNEKGELVQLLANGEASAASVESTEMNSSNGSSSSSVEQQQLSHETQPTEQPAAGPAGRPAGDLKNVDQLEAQPELSSQIDANEAQEQANRQQQQQQQLHSDQTGQDTQTMEGSGETGDSSREPPMVANRPVAISVGGRQRLQLIPNGGAGNADQVISVIGGSPEAVEGHPDGRGQFLMVAYKPQHLINMTSETEESGEVNMLETRMPYNEESASSLIAAKDLLRQPVRATQMMLRPISVAQVNSELPIVRLQPQFNMTDIRSFLSRFRPSETTDLGLPSKLLYLQSQVGNQVPSASSLHLAPLDGHSSNHQRFAQPSWPPSLGQTDQSFNETSVHTYTPDLPTPGGSEAGAPDIYGHRLLSRLVKNNGSLSLNQRQNLMENLALLRQLHQQVESKQRLQTTTHHLHQQLSHLPTPIGSHLLANGSEANKLTNQHLLSLMSELKLTNGSAMTGGTNSGSSGSGDHSISGNGFTDLNMAGLSSAPAVGAKQTAKFELTQASNQQAGAKHLSSHPATRTLAVSTTNGFGDHFQPSASTKGSGLVRDPSDRLAGKAASVPDGQDFHSYIKPLQAPSPSLPAPPTTNDFADFRDSNGLSNIALAFILVVSFITLTIIAASMIYRRRRLTVSRSADLQSKTRLNPLRRTRQFMRANFVTSNDATSAKTINMNNSSLPLVKSRLFGRSNQTIGDKSSMLRSSGRKLAQASREPSSEDTSVSTFTGDKRLYGPDSSRADIRTLDTRIQRPSHLKSLISSPECLLGHTKTKQLASNRPVNQAPETLGSSSSSSGYLNTNNRVSDSCVKQTLARTSSPARDPGCSGRNYSFEKVLCDPRHHPNYSSSTKRSMATEKRSAVEQKVNYSNRMSTIRSVNDSSVARDSNLTKRFPDDTDRVSFRTGLKDYHWPSTE